MEDSEQKLESIRAQARRQAAEQAQAEAAKRRKSAREERRNPKADRITWGHVAMALFVISGGLWLLLSKEPEPSPDEFEESLTKSAEAMREYRNTAFAMAAVRELSSRGISADEAGADSVQYLADDLYALTFRASGEVYRIRGEYVCDDGFELMPDNMTDPLCYRWR